jgi:DNA-binding transcriptional LysR family regulator
MHRPILGRITRAATLRQLQVFEALARLNSFTRVAEEMHLTQPTISMQVKKLAEAVELPLTEQVGKDVYLTDAGHELAAVCREVLIAFEHLEERINQLKGLEGGRVRLAVISTAQYFLPQVMQLFLAQFPNINIIMEVVNKEHLLSRLAENQDDLYILGQPPEGSPVISERLAINPLVFVAARHFDLPEGRVLTIDDLNGVPFLMREPGSGIRDQIEQVFRDMGYKPAVRMILGSNEAIRLGVMSGLGISVVSLHTVRDELKRKEIKVLPVAGFPIERYWYLAWAKGKSLSLSATRFMETLRLQGVALDAEIRSLLVKTRKQQQQSLESLR